METKVEITIPESAMELGIAQRTPSEAAVETAMSAMIGADTKAAIRYPDGVEGDTTEVLLWITATPDARIDISDCRSARRAFRKAVSHHAGVRSSRVDVEISDPEPDL